jgi:hypothetical protein
MKIEIRRVSRVVDTYLLSIAGMSPNQMPDAMFRSLGALDENTLFAPGVEDCRKAYQNNWSHWVFNGKPWVPFFGSPHDVHPSNCFRAYNADAEIRANKIPAGTYTRSSNEWRLMQGTLQ